MVRSIRLFTALLTAPVLLGLALLALGGLLPAAGAGVLDLDDWKTDSSGWADARVGTRVHYRTTRERHVPGMKRPVKTIIESERTLTRIEDARLVFRTRVKAGSEWQAANVATEARPTKDTFSVESEVQSTGVKVTIGGETYICKQISYTRSRDGAKDDQIVAWIHETRGVLKTERGTGPSSIVTHTVTRFSVERKIGDVTLDCREFSIEELGTKGRVLVSNDIPGRIVEMRITVKREGASSTLTRTLVGFTTPSSPSSLPPKK